MIKNNNFGNEYVKGDATRDEEIKRQRWSFNGKEEVKVSKSVRCDSRFSALVPADRS